MSDKLDDLIKGASARMRKQQQQRVDEKQLKEETERKADFDRFKRHVEAAIGQEVLDALAPVKFNANFGQNSLAFSRNGRWFQLQQVAGQLVQIDESPDGMNFQRSWGNQFNLSNPDAKDVFLDQLGSLLNKPPRS